MVLHLKTCCCGCSLRTGTIIIGSLFLLGSVASLLITIGALFGSEQYVKNILDEDEPKNQNFLIPFMETVTTESPQDIEFRNLVTKVIIGVLIVSLVLSLVEIVLGILLLVGVHLKRPSLVKAWIVYGVIDVVLCVILLLSNLFLARVVGEKDYRDLFALLIGIPFRIYYLLVVNSYHTELIANNLPIAPKFV